MGVHSLDVDLTSLWKQATREFDASNPKANREYLEHNETPETVTRYLRHKKRQAALKSNSCGPILERLDVIAEIGDIAMKAAPESIGLVWTGFRFVFKMILFDISTCNALVDAVDFFSEVVLVCAVYGKRYLNKTQPDSPIKEEVLKRVPRALSTVLEFSYLVQKFFKHSATRVIRNLFTGTDFKLQGTIQKSRVECEALRHIDDAGFKEEIRNGNEQFQKVMNGLSKSLKSKLNHLNEEIMKLKEQGDENKILEEIERNNEWFRSGQIADITLPRDRHNDNISKRQENSCDWIFGKHVAEYQSWIDRDPKRLSINRRRESTYHRMLWLYGDGGVGKSMLVSTVISELQDNRNHLVVYFFCKLGDEWSQNGARIMLHICAQLFRRGSEGNVDLQREFNKVMTICIL